ncbi:LysR family transcriptional regulator [Pigmentiphaga soli]|uniref:LysR family transcriptional regulator n=2 Tax=Pigmentiphaga soli TaxID=1007095 RepID=A0ABP8H5B4_9BURK
MQIDFLGMQAFLSIVEQGGFLQAAAHLNLSQTAVSHRIRKLEDALGMKLLTRTTREVTLTDAGRALLPRVRSALRELELSYELMRQHRHNAPRWLAFACLPTLAATQLSPVLRRFAGLYPDVAVRVFDSAVDEIFEHVESEAAAFGITISTAHRFDLSIEPFAEEPFVLVCPVGHRLAGEPAVHWEQLTDDVLIRISLPAGNATTIDDALGDRRTAFRWSYESQHTAVALDFVAAGLGLSVVPALCATARTGVVVRPLVEPAISRQLALVTRRNASLSGLERALRDIAIDQIRLSLSAG